VTRVVTVYEVVAPDTGNLVSVTNDPDEAQRQSHAGRRVTAETTEVLMS
jgi:hypothetical protein